MNFRPGKHVQQYVINSLISQGGMGMVWQAVDTRTNKLVAIKTLANDLFIDPAFKLRMQDEANRHLRLKHPNIVPVLAVFESHGETCIVMELIVGVSLYGLLKQNEQHRLDEPTAITIAKDVLEALDYAHRQAIFHRDVKPSNIVLDRTNRALLIDFGIAVAVGEERRTRTGHIVGTTLYMSPEQIARPKEIDHRSDVYSVGCVIYEMLCGKTPFVKGQNGVGVTDFEIQQAHVHKQPVSLQKQVAGISPYLDEIVMKALEKDPDKRIPGCGEFIRLLEQAGEHRDDRPDIMPVENKQRRGRIIKLALGVLIVLLFGLFILIMVMDT